MHLSSFSVGWSLLLHLAKRATLVCLRGSVGGRLRRKCACSFFSAPGRCSTSLTKADMACKDWLMCLISRLRSELRRMLWLGALDGVSRVMSLEFLLKHCLGILVGISLLLSSSSLLQDDGLIFEAMVGVAFQRSWLLDGDGEVIFLWHMVMKCS